MRNHRVTGKPTKGNGEKAVVLVSEMNDFQQG
jgi:hypothetical protein